MTEKRTDTEDSLQKLHERIVALEKYVEDGKDYILNYIDDAGKALNILLNKFKAEFDEDRKLRLEREAVIVKKLTDHEQETYKNYENQIETRESLYGSLKATLDNHIKHIDKSDTRFQTNFEKELSKLRNDYRSESETRQREDDEIVEALNRYTIKLQKSLKIINSTEM